MHAFKSQKFEPKTIRSIGKPEKTNKEDKTKNCTHWRKPPNAYKYLTSPASQDTERTLSLSPSPAHTTDPQELCLLRVPWLPCGHQSSATCSCLHSCRRPPPPTWCSTSAAMSTPLGTLQRPPKNRIVAFAKTFAEFFGCLCSEFHVTMHIGDPAKPYFLHVDTGSNLTSLECKVGSKVTSWFQTLCFPLRVMVH